MVRDKRIIYFSCSWSLGFEGSTLMYLDGSGPPAAEATPASALASPQHTGSITSSCPSWRPGSLLKWVLLVLVPLLEGHARGAVRTAAREVAGAAGPLVTHEPVYLGTRVPPSLVITQVPYP